MAKISRAIVRTTGTKRFAVIVSIVALLGPPDSYARELTIAVASNFRETAEKIAIEFTEETAIPVRLSYGSTGKLYAQIQYGAPFDVFLAADAARPKRLEDEGFVFPASRMTYAIGTLHLVSADAAMRGRDCLQALKQGDFRRLAIANPKTAPYGSAARAFLVSMDLWNSTHQRVVRGENITQALQFVATGNATLGLIASAQVQGRFVPPLSCSMPLPAEHYPPIVQQAVVLAASSNAKDARQFLDFLGRDTVRQRIIADGYRVPD